MSKSFKGEARAQARAVQARRAARKAAHSNFESPDKIFESPLRESPFHIVKNRVDGRASQPVGVRASGLDAKKALWPKDSLLYK